MKKLLFGLLSLLVMTVLAEITFYPIHDTFTMSPLNRSIEPLNHELYNEANGLYDAYEDDIWYLGEWSGGVESRWDALGCSVQDYIEQYYYTPAPNQYGWTYVMCQCREDGFDDPNYFQDQFYLDANL